MPDTKFSLAALREHLRKFLWIYIVGVGICLILTNLLWTTTAPRTPMEQVIQVYLADGYANGEAMKGVAQEMLRRTQAYDETLLEVEFLSMPYTEDDYYSTMLLMTRLTTGDADAFLCGQAAMDQLIGTGVALPLDDYAAGGWLSAFDLEPFYAQVQEAEESEPYTILAGFRMDKVTVLSKLGAIDNSGAYLLVTSNGTNVDTTLKALENMVDILMEDEADAAAEGTEPAA